MSRRIVGQEIVIFGSTGIRSTPLNAFAPIGLDVPATDLEIRVLEQIDLGATVSIRRGATTVALFGGVGTDEMVGAQFPPFLLDGQPLSSHHFKSDGQLTLCVTAYREEA